MTPSIVSFCRGLPLNLIIPCVEIKIYGAAYPLPSSNNHLWSARNHPRYIFKNLLSICTNWKIVGSNFFGKLKIDGNLVVKSKVPPRSGSVALRMLNAVHRNGPSSCFKKKNKKNTWNKAYSEEWIWTRRFLYIIYLHSNKLLRIKLENYM